MPDVPDTRFPHCPPEVCTWLTQLFQEYDLDIECIRQAWEREGRVMVPDLEPEQSALRWDHQLILGQIPSGSHVLDCGCGTGELLARLRRDLGVSGQGIEIDQEAVTEAVGRGVPVLQVDLDVGLDFFADCSFDYAILEKTLQTVHHPLVVLHEMLRVGRRAIVSFPNFGHWRNRLQLLLTGRMPRTRDIPFRWYDTPNIHHLTIGDFFEMCQDLRATQWQGWGRAGDDIHPYVSQDDLMAEEALFILSRD